MVSSLELLEVEEYEPEEPLLLPPSPDEADDVEADDVRVAPPAPPVFVAGPPSPAPVSSPVAVPLLSVVPASTCPFVALKLVGCANPVPPPPAPLVALEPEDEPEPEGQKVTL
ncbi:hypothetical protein JCM10450v2_005016 [Rhodotorula kratochvilovae]